MAAERLGVEEEAAWAGFLRTHERIWRELEAGLAPLPVSLAEYDVLLALEDADDDGIRMSDLAGRRLMSSGGFTRLADRLERRGLLVRRRSAVDGRSLHASMTDAGRELLEQARARHLADVRALFIDRLGPEDLRTMTALWERLAQEPGSRPGPR